MRQYPENSKQGIALSHDPIARLVQAWPETFFRSLGEEIDAAFAQAHRLTAEKIAPPERRGALGQLRHFLAEDGFRSAGRAAGLNVHVPDTSPKGACYSVVERDGNFMIRSNVLSHCGQPRPTKFRRRWSTLNEWLSPWQIDLFDRNRPQPSPDNLCAMLVVTASKNGDPMLPAFAGVGIPSHDLSSWIKLSSIEDIIALYNAPAEQKDVPVDIADRAVPKLKRKGPSEQG